MTDYFVRLTKHLKKKKGLILILHPEASNRLDRITSGLMLICKTSKDADTIGFEMRSRNIEKEYICRVSGEFPRYKNMKYM
jgi:23S rRNA-/tRNA-specific pseudouridylate synthase